MLRERQIALLSLEEKIDTSSAAGELIFHVFGAIAHFKRRLISERSEKRGVAAARAKGKRTRAATAGHKKVEAARQNWSRREPHPPKPPDNSASAGPQSIGK